MTITEDTTRADIMEAITYLSATAARSQHVVGSGEYKTPWDHQHAEIDRLLTTLDTLPA